MLIPWFPQLCNPAPPPTATATKTKWLFFSKLCHQLLGRLVFHFSFFPQYMPVKPYKNSKMTNIPEINGVQFFICKVKWVRNGLSHIATIQSRLKSGTQRPEASLTQLKKNKDKNPSSILSATGLTEPRNLGQVLVACILWGYYVYHQKAP